MIDFTKLKNSDTLRLDLSKSIGNTNVGLNRNAKDELYISRVKKNFIHQQKFKNENVILNKEIKQVIDFKKRKRRTIQIEKKREILL